MRSRRAHRGAVGPPRLELTERLPTRPAGRPPLLFVHGLGHGAWCWEHWLDGAAEAGFAAYAVSLRGHGNSQGHDRLKWTTLGRYVDDVQRTAESLPSPPVLIGHSLGGLVVQLTLARYRTPAAVLVTPTPAKPAIRSTLLIARQHPTDVGRMLCGATLPLRSEYLFAELDADEAHRQAARCDAESAVAQYQLLLHRPPPPPLGDPPVLVLATPDDRLIALDEARQTAARYHATLIEFPGMGHDLMLDRRWAEPLSVLLDWLSSQHLPAATAA